MFIGWASTLLWLPAIADKKGRRMLYWIGMIIDLALFTGLLLTQELLVMIFIQFCNGAMSSIRVNVGYVYLMELMPKKAQTPVTSGRFTEEAFIYVLATLYFWKISKHWFYFVFIGYIWNIISVIGMYWLPESPRYLMNIGKYEEAKKVFQYIAKLNRKEFVADRHSRLFST